MTSLPFLLSLALLAVACYKIGYQRCCDSSGQGVVIRDATLTWRHFLTLRYVKAARVVVQRCTIIDTPPSIKTNTLLRDHLLRLKWRTSDLTVCDCRFVFKGAT